LKLGKGNKTETSCSEIFNAGFFVVSKAQFLRAPGAYKLVCDQARKKCNAAHRKKDKLKGL